MGNRQQENTGVPEQQMTETAWSTTGSVAMAKWNGYLVKIVFTIITVFVVTTLSSPA